MKYRLAQLIDVPLGRWSEHSLRTNNGYASVMLYRGQTSCKAFINSCPHQGRRMDYAQDEFLLTPDGQIVCPAHGATFDPESGLCTNGPCVGQSLLELSVEIEDKEVWLEIE